MLAQFKREVRYALDEPRPHREVVQRRAAQLLVILELADSSPPTSFE
jgi:hypothetical protein